MRPSFKTIAASLAIGIFFGFSAAQAGEIIFIENPDDFWGINQQAQPAAPALAPTAEAQPQAAAAPAEPRSEISASNTVNFIAPHYGAPSLKDMQILGRWVGNVQFKVGSIGDKLFVIAPNGQIKRLPLNTEANNVVIPENSPIVQHMTTGEEISNKDQPADGPTFKLGQKGLLKPTVVGTRTQMIDGKPVIVGGAIISEISYAPAQVKTQEKTFSRVYATKRSVKIKKRRVQK